MHRQAMFALTVCTVAIVGGGCRPGPSKTESVQVDLTMEPSPPVVGKVDVSVRLADANGAALTSAEVRLEGNMNHAGMKPSFASLLEGDPGAYIGKLDFTMGGDWYVLVTAKLPDGQVVERKIDVPGVKSP